MMITFPDTWSCRTSLLWVLQQTSSAARQLPEQCINFFWMSGVISTCDECFHQS